MHLRTLKIIQVLLENDNRPITISYIAKELQVSNKTIRNNLDFVEKLLEEHNLKLVRKTGVGTYIDGDGQDKLKMLIYIKSYNQANQQYTAKDRQLYILNQLLVKNRSITIADMQEELFISRPSVYKDIERVREWLSEREIEVVLGDNNSLAIKSGEKRIRKAITDLFFLSEEYDELFELIEGPKETGKSNLAAMNFLSYAQKDDILGLDYEKVNKIILKLENIIEVKFTPKDLLRLTIDYGISISRMMEGKYVEMKDATLTELKELQKIKMEEFFRDIEREFNIRITLAEEGYLIGLTIASKTHFDSTNWNINKKMLFLNNLIVQEIIDLTKKEFNISYEMDFHKGLLHHLKSVTNKIKYNLEFRNIMVDDIRIKYPDAFNIALKSRPIFKDYYGFEIPLEEVAYIALHIAAAIERSKVPLKTYVVYHSSYSEIKLVVETLRNHFKQLDIDKIIPISMVDTIEDEDIDLIITTRKLRDGFNEDIDIVVVPTILISDNLMKLSEIFTEIYNRKNSIRLKKLP